MWLLKTSVILLSLLSFCYLMEITITIGKERGTACSHGSCGYADVRFVVECVNS